MAAGRKKRHESRKRATPLEGNSVDNEVSNAMPCEKKRNNTALRTTTTCSRSVLVEPLSCCSVMQLSSFHANDHCEYSTTEKSGDVTRIMCPQIGQVSDVFFGWNRRSHAL
jgi:hypothetical protein